MNTEELRCPQNGIHLWILSAARRLSFLALSDLEIFERIHALTRNGRRHVPASEIVKSIAKIRNTDISGLGNRCAWALPKPQYEPQTLERLAGRCPVAVDAEYLRMRSKFTLHNRTPAGFLHKLYQPGERVIVLDDFESQGCQVWQHPGPTGDLSTLNHLERGRFGVWYLANPSDGEFHYNPREGKFSRRSLESITSWRYFVLESDQADPDVWLRALVQLPLAISAIYSSGGKSVHALIRIDAGSKADWERIVAALKPTLVTLGACPGSLSAVRLSRLPNCMRGQTGQLQRLLYLDDDPDDIPICRKAPRDPDTLEAAWRKAL